MALHDATFDYLRPTDMQVSTMHELREAAKVYATVLDGLLPEGSDKTYILRQLRTIAMWANVCVTRHVDGAPRGPQLSEEAAD